MRHAIGCLLLLAAAAVPAAERPGDYAYGARLEADGREALYEVALPAAAYRGVAFADLRDVRVFNGGGEVVPHAWRARRLQSVENEPPVTLALFPLRAASGATLDGLSIRVHRGTGGAVTVDVAGDTPDRSAPTRTVGYLVDLTTLERGLRALDLDWHPVPGGFAARLRVDGSDDLGSWRQLVAAAPLVDLEMAGQRLQQKRVELPRQAVKYLRLSWVAKSDGTLPPELTGARAELIAKSVAAQREWASVESTKGEKPGEYAFDTRAHFPVDRVRVHLPEANTVVQVELLARDATDKPWRRITTGVVYRLRKGDAEIVSPDLVAGHASERYWMVRVDQRGGGVGSGAPRLEVGWVPHQLVFAARGPAPFQLAYGKRDAQPAAYAIEALVPGFREDAAATIRAAKAAEAQSINVQAAKALAPTELGGEARRVETFDWKRWSLWGALILGVVILAGMAWRLAKQLDKPAAPGARDDASGSDRPG
jgi:hypothetical protein